MMIITSKLFFNRRVKKEDEDASVITTDDDSTYKSDDVDPLNTSIGSGTNSDSMSSCEAENEKKALEFLTSLRSLINEKNETGGKYSHLQIKTPMNKCLYSLISFSFFILSSS